MRELYFVRHGQTDYNKKHIVQGRGIDSDLNEWGRDQAQALYNHYAHLDFEHIYISTLKRTEQTVAHFLANEISYTKTPLIDEISWGIHEGMEGAPEMHQRYKDMVTSWSAGDYDVRLEGAESARELGNRSREFVDMLSDIPYDRVLICTHGRTMRCLMCVLQGLPLSDMERYSIKNTGVSIFDHNGEIYRLRLYNDRSHLGDG